jgi:hypothetical protein
MSSTSQILSGFFKSGHVVVMTFAFYLSDFIVGSKQTVLWFYGHTGKIKIAYKAAVLPGQTAQ